MCKNSQMKRERLSERRDIHDFFEKKADHAFQGEFEAQPKLSEAQSGLDRREWRMRNADIACSFCNWHAAPIPEDGTLSGKSID